MLSLFKPHYFLKDIVPNTYIDIHNHLLPGIDDGAQTIEDTNKLITQMKALNITSAIATPHTYSGIWNNTPSTIKTAYEIAVEPENNNAFIKGYASEYMLDKTLIDRLNSEPLLCIYDSYVLVELPIFNNPIDLYEMLFEIKSNDYKIIIAHPERYHYFHNAIDKLKKLKNYGVYFQLNLLALTGYYGTETKKCAEQLLDNDLYDFTGTDIHNHRQIERFINKPISYNKKNKLGDLLTKNAIFLEKAATL